MNTLSISSNIIQRIPLLTPVVKKYSCEIDHTLLKQRIYTIAILTIAALAVSMAIATVLPIFFIAVPIIPIFSIGVLSLDLKIAKKTIDTKAVDKYLTMTHPSQSATSHIKHNLKAAQLLVNSNGDVNKLNAVNEKLIDNLSDLAIFKLLVDNGANVKDLDRHGIAHFKRFAQQENPAYLEYMLQTNKISPVNLTADEQVDLWLNIGNMKSGELLKDHGFDVNIRDTNGYTPLLKLVAAISSPFYIHSGRLGYCMLTQTLLVYGASHTLTVWHEGEQQNAIQINTNQKVAILLQNL